MTLRFCLFFCMLLIFFTWEISILEANTEIIKTPSEDNKLLTDTLITLFGFVLTIYAVVVGYLYKTFVQNAKDRVSLTAGRIENELKENVLKHLINGIKYEVSNEVFKKYNSILFKFLLDKDKEDLHKRQEICKIWVEEVFEQVIEHLETQLEICRRNEEINAAINKKNNKNNAN